MTFVKMIDERDAIIQGMTLKIGFLWYFLECFHWKIAHRSPMRFIWEIYSSKSNFMLRNIIKHNQNEFLNPSESSFMSSWNIVKKTPSLFLLLIHGLVQNFQDTFSRCCSSSLRGRAKTLHNCGFSIKLNVNSVLICRKLKKIFGR